MHQCNMRAFRKSMLIGDSNDLYNCLQMANVVEEFNILISEERKYHK